MVTRFKDGGARWPSAKTPPASADVLASASPPVKVEVVRADGSRATFIITRITIVRKKAFPLNAVFRPTDEPALRLITCTGFFDTSTGHYIDSLIVWGKPAT
jgi:hypothetical protein